ncbi:LysR family transcriptional regulator [Bifidobacterium phasiani]|uniref:LysR family transcriptional regulator n=1 Tax=Bifidobacterium phasiani TaxID=2834431 RepID=A0ABS6WB86_9BIFI|nr:LysR family transcriptional regulator [Bifidobacterium phasiani]MBW3083784.1 LysR family transcriptional regulator [Bifidobacterium phasiani]
MDIEQLRQFDAVAAYGTISAAADELRMPQPTLSRSIKRLEDELGHPLLRREGRHVEINETGRIALEYIRPILRDERLMREALDRIAAAANALRIGTVAPAPLWHLTALIVERFPGIMLSSETITQREIERLLMNGVIDLAISTSELRFPAFRTCRLMAEDLFVAVPPDHPFAAKPSVTLAELDGETFLLYSEIGFWRDFCNRYMPHSHFILQEDREVFRQLVATTTTPFFVTNAPYQRMDTIDANHVAVPISDDAAKAVYYLVARTDAGGGTQEVFDWVSRQTARESGAADGTAARV